MRKHWCALGVLAGSLALPGSAHAEDETTPYAECTKAPTDSETLAAKGAYQAGNVSFDEADYPRAITYWEDAYRRDCTANLLLKNLARAYELYGQKRHAVLALQTFLVREPTSSDKEQIQRRIEVLEQQITPERAAVARPATPTPATNPPVTAPASATTHAEPVTPQEASDGKRPLAPLIVAGVGGAVFVVSGVVYLTANKDVKHYEGLCNVSGIAHNCGTGPDATSNAQAANSARHREQASGVVTIVGGAALATGLILYFTLPKSGATKTAEAGTLWKPRVDPAVAPGFAGLSLSGVF